MINRFKSLIYLFDAYTVLVWVWMLVEFLSRESVHTPAGISTVYVTLVGVYVGDKEIQRQRRRYFSRNQRGELFVLLWVGTLIALSIVIAFRGYRNGYRLPADLPIVTASVLVFWLLSEYLKKKTKKHSRT
jgi:hypothetical protein